MNDRLIDRSVAQRPDVAGNEADEQAAIRLDRAQTELAHGRAIRVIDAEAGGQGEATLGVLAIAVEGLTAPRLGWMHSLGMPLHLLLTAERAAALGLRAEPVPGAVGAPAWVALPGDISLDALQDWAAVSAAVAPGAPTPRLLIPAPALTPLLECALAVAKNARLVPALLVALLSAANAPRLAAAQLLSVSRRDVQRADRGGLPALHRVSDAQVAIEAYGDCEVVLFREAHGAAEQVAIVVGQPDFAQPVTVRLHSACLTGDLLGSLRCDCGDQLRRAIARLAEHGGVLLYLQQEGRSIGLANKLRAYRLQDEGLDTIDADRYLGFLADERDYAPALAMLKALGITRVRLLTNNPRKIAAIEAGGIEVVERLALHGPVNAHNARYIETKQQRAGHLKED